MTESKRGTSEAQNLPSIRPGIEGYADGMRMFPRLKEWENQIALQTLREGKTVDELRNITPFRQYLGVDTRARLAGEHSPFSSFTSLFAESPSIDMLVSFGNFHTIRTWTWTLAKQYPNLNLPLEQFYQDALLHIVPYQARAYGSSRSAAFSTRLAQSSTSGGACVFTTRSGMFLCCSQRVAIIGRSSLACHGHNGS